MSVWMSWIEFSLTTTTRGICDATRPCILTNPYQRPIDTALEAVRGGVHLEHAVAGDRMVQGDDQRDLLLELGDAVAETLIVVDEVELAESCPEVVVDTCAERQRLGELAGAEHGGLEEVVPRLELPVGGETPGVVVVEQVEARQLRERDPLVEIRVRLPAEDLDRVPEVGERLGEMTGVDALAADVRLAPVGQIRERQRRVGIETGRFGHRDRLSVHRYR